MENFRKAREDEEASRAMRAAKKLHEDQDAEEVGSVTSFHTTLTPSGTHPQLEV